MAIDVVVINYHTDVLLQDFIHSFKDHAQVGCTLTVVDVEVDQDSASLADDEWGLSWLTTRENVGYARACNLGASHGTNDVILLANADTLLSSGLEECHDALMAHDDWGVLGPRQVNERNQITAGGIFGTDRSISQRGWNEIDRGQFSDIRTDAMSVSGSLYFIKRKLWQELTDCKYMKAFQPDGVGAFLHTPHYYEETACSYHARAHGYKIVYYGPVQMTHLWHKASDHGGWADRQVEKSKHMMRQFCATHNIVCE